MGYWAVVLTAGHLIYSDGVLLEPAIGHSIRSSQEEEELSFVLLTLRPHHLPKPANILVLLAKPFILGVLLHLIDVYGCAAG